LDRIWSVDVDWGGVWGRIPLHTTYDFLAVIAVVDVRRYYLFVGVVVAGYIKGIESERGGVIGKVRESQVVVFHDLFLPMVVDGLFYHLNSGCGAG